MALVRFVWSTIVFNTKLAIKKGVLRAWPHVHYVWPTLVSKSILVIKMGCCKTPPFAFNLAISKCFNTNSRSKGYINFNGGLPTFAIVQIRVEWRLNGVSLCRIASNGVGLWVGTASSS